MKRENVSNKRLKCRIGKGFKKVFSHFSVVFITFIFLSLAIIAFHPIFSFFGRVSWCAIRCFCGRIFWAECFLVSYCLLFAFALYLFLLLLSLYSFACFYAY
jgi:hypothetical protein